MGTRTLRTYVTTGYEHQLAHAMEILNAKERHDGIAPFDRMLVTLLDLYVRGDYSRTHTVHGVRRKYDLLAAIPTFVPPRNGGIKVDVEVTDPRKGGGQYLGNTAINLLTAVRHDLLDKHYMQTAPDDARTALGGLCLTAALASRRQKRAFGLKLFAVGA